VRAFEPAAETPERAGGESKGLLLPLMPLRFAKSYARAAVAAGVSEELASLASPFAF